MRWTETSWFKHTCAGVACIFFSTSATPMAFGFSPPRLVASFSKNQMMANDLFKSQLGDQVSSLMDKVNNQLHELKALPNIEELKKRQITPEVSCGVPEVNPLANSVVAPFTSPSALNVEQGITHLETKGTDNGNDTPFTKRRGDVKSESYTQWFNWLSSLLVSEAHAQTPDPNLASTPDANTTDQFIVDKAQELGNDANAIFAFVRDEIGYESYKGSLRGARGTLWSNAGNSLDQASLLIALLRASGVPARYAEGALSDPLSQELILSMFPNPTRVVGCPPNDVERADPANDLQLLAETREHYWVQADLGSGFLDLDPTLGSAQVDQAFTTADSTFSEVSDSLRHKVSLRLNVEFNDSFTGALQDRKTVLDQTFNTVALVGHPLSVGNFVNTVETPGPVFTSTTHTYSPYLIIGDNDDDIGNDELLRGEDYQEILTNFPLSTQFLTGVFLEMEVVEPEDESGQRATELHQRDIFDRIGFAARQNGETTNVGGATDGSPTLSPLDFATVNVLGGLQSIEAIALQKDPLELLLQAGQSIAPEVQSLPTDSPLTSEQGDVFNRALKISIDATRKALELVSIVYAYNSDIGLRELEGLLSSRATYVTPRLIVALNKVEDQNSTVKLDIQKVDARIIPAPGQAKEIIGEVEGISINRKISIPFLFNMTRGVFESMLERETLSQVLGINSISIDDIFRDLAGPEDVALITERNLEDLESLDISNIGKARISKAALEGKLILTPSHMVMVQNTSTIGWLETDPDTGWTISVMEDGGHLSSFEYGTLKFIGNNLVNAPVGFLAGYLNFWLSGVGGIIGTAVAVAAGALDLDPKEQIRVAIITANIYMARNLLLIRPLIIASSLIATGNILAARFFEVGYLAAWIACRALMEVFLQRDPQVFLFLSNELGQIPLVEPEATPNVEVQIVPDDLFTLPVNGAELPSVFRAQIQNLGPDEDTFALNFSQVPSGFTIQSSVPELTLPAGVTGEIGICVIPDGPLGNVGDPASFTANVMSTTDGTVNATDTEPFTIPAVPGIALSSLPVTLSSVRGNRSRPR